MDNSVIINSKIFDPWFITGITDAEGSFVCIIRKSLGHRLNWRVEVVFQIGLHKKDLDLLKSIKAYFDDIGIISENNKDNMCAFRVTSPKQIFEHIIPHFDNYPLITQKLIDYNLFKNIIELMLIKEHLTQEGLQKIINIRASLNLGLSDILKEAFPKTEPVLRSIVTNQIIPDPQWVSGFATGEGCFFIKIIKGRNISGAGVQILFQLAQHIRDEQLLKNLSNFFNCGKYIKTPNQEWGYYQCTKFLDNYEIIKPFFEKYPIKGIKLKDFEDWSKVSDMIKNKEHLTSDGVSKIIKIKSGMNIGRSLDLD